MLQVTNTDVIQELVKKARLQSNQGVVTKLSDTIVPTIELNPMLVKYSNLTYYAVGSNGNVTVGTLPADRDFFLTAISITSIKDATSDNSDSYMYLVRDDGSEIRFTLAGITLTAQTQSLNLSFPLPIKLKRGSNIQVIKTSTTVGTCRNAATIVGYLVEVKD